jgi:hypothetical protein
MAAELNIRLGITGAQEAKQQLEQVTQAGNQAGQRINQGATQASQGMEALSGALTRVQQNSQGLQVARQSLDAAGTAANSASGGMQRFGQVMGQAGFQIQDFAVQVSAGQSALVALGQQGSQLLGIFGVGGAIAGAALTVGVLAAQLMGAGEAADTLTEAVKGVEDAFKRVEAQAERRERWMEREAEAVNRLASEYRNMGLAQARAESLLVERQGAALDAEAVRMQGALRGSAGSSLEGRLRERTVSNEFQVEWTVPVAQNFERLSNLMAELPAAAGRTAEVIRQIATESQTLSRSGVEGAASLVNLRNAALDLLPAAARLDEAQRTLAVQTIAVGQAMGLEQQALQQYAERFGVLSGEIMRAANSLAALREAGVGIPTDRIANEIAANRRILAAIEGGGREAGAEQQSREQRSTNIARRASELEAQTLERFREQGMGLDQAREAVREMRTEFVALATTAEDTGRAVTEGLRAPAAAARTAAAAMSEAEREYQQILRQSESTIQRTLSAEEQRAATIQRLSGFLREGAITQAQYTQGVEAVTRAAEAQAEQQRRRDAEREAERSQREQERNAERAQREADSFAARWGDRLADATTQGLFDGFQRGQSFAQTMATTLRNLLRQSVSAGLSQMVFQPMVGQLASSITGGPVGGMAGAGGLGGFGGIGSLSNLFNGGMVNTSWGGLNSVLNTPIFGGGAGNLAAAGAAGDGGALLAHGGSGAGATFGNALGALGYGFGAFQGFSRGGVGGTIQGVGNAAAAIMAMTPAAPFAPFVAIGSSIIGSLIPQAPPRGFVSYGIGADGRLGGLGDMHRRTSPADRQKLANEVNQYLANLQAQLDQFGIRFDTGGLRATTGVDTVWRDQGIPLGDFGSGDHLNPSAGPDVVIPRALASLGRSADPNIQRILQRDRGPNEGSIQSFLDDANFVRSVYNPAMEAAANRVSDFQRAVAQLVTPLDAAIENSRKLGLATEELVAYRTREFDKLVEQRNLTLNGFWTNFDLRSRRARGENGVDMLLTEFDSAAGQEMRNLRQQLESLGTTASETASFLRGLETTQAEERLAVQRRFAEESVRIEQQRGQAIRDWLAGQRGSTAAGLSPTDALAGARGEFTRDLRLAGLGDENALSRITGSADALLGAGRDVYASGQQFQALRDSVLASLEALPATQRIAIRESAILAANAGTAMPGAATALTYREPDWTALNRMATGIEDIRGIARELAATTRELVSATRELMAITRDMRDEVAGARVDARLSATATRLGVVA